MYHKTATTLVFVAFFFASETFSWMGMNVAKAVESAELRLYSFRLKDLIPGMITVFQIHWLYSGEHKFKWELIFKILRHK